jgi:hypothetical protein
VKQLDELRQERDKLEVGCAQVKRELDELGSLSEQMETQLREAKVLYFFFIIIILKFRIR